MNEKAKVQVKQMQDLEAVGDSLASKAYRNRQTNMARELAFRQNESAVISLGQGHMYVGVSSRLAWSFLKSQFSDSLEGRSVL